MNLSKPLYTLKEIMRKREEAPQGAAAKYARMQGQKVRIYYQDLRGTHRSLIGTITDIDGDNLWLENGEWRGCLDCANARICIISTIDGWDAWHETEFKEEQ
jgi:hypothetical protein